jgi:hypothetical protein
MYLKNALPIFFSLLTCANFFTPQLHGIRDDQTIPGKLHRKFVRIKSRSTGQYLAARWIQNRWRLQLVSTPAHDPSTKFKIEVKLDKKRFTDKIYIKSHIAGGRYLRSYRNNTAFENFNRKAWQEWKIEGESLDKCGLWHSRYQFLRIHKPWKNKDFSLGWTGGTNMSVKDAQFSIEIVSNAPFKYLMKIKGEKFKQISVRNPNSAWGVKADNTAWRFEAFDWVKAPGAISQISVGSDGTVWGIDPNNNVKRWAGKTFMTMPGKLKQISVGNRNHIYGISLANQLLKWDGKEKKWALHNTTKLKSISVGEDGRVHAINQLNFAGRIPFWQKIESDTIRFKQLSAGHSYNVWAIGTDDNLYWFNGIQFVQIPKSRLWIETDPLTFKYISAGTGSTKYGLSLWGITNDGRIYKFETPDWSYLLARRLKKISVANEDNIWGVGLNNIAYQWKNNIWRPAAGTEKITEISTGSDRSVWALNREINRGRDFVIRRKVGNAWKKDLPGRLRAISIGSSNLAWGIGLKNRLWKWNGSRWFKQLGRYTFKDVTTSYDGSRVYATRSTGDSRYHEKVYQIVPKFEIVPIVPATSFYKAKFKYISVNTNKSTNKFDLWGTSHSADLVRLYTNSQFAYEELADGIAQVSVGNDGTIWGVTPTGITVKIRRGPRDMAQEAAALSLERAQLATIARFDKYITDLEATKQETNFDKKIIKYKKFKSDILRNRESYDKFMKQFDELIFNRKTDHLPKLDEFISVLMREIGYLVETIDRYGEIEARRHTEFNRARLNSILNSLKEKKEIVKKPVAYSALLARATTEFMGKRAMVLRATGKDLANLTEEAKIVRTGTPEYSAFINRVGKWIDNLDELVANKEKHPEVSIDSLFKRIKEELDAYSAWALKILTEQRDKIRDLIKKHEKAEKGVITLDKTRVRIAVPMIGRGGITPEVLSATLTASHDNIFTAADTANENQERWFKNFRIIINNVEQLPIDKMDSYKDFIKSTEDSQEFFSFTEGKEELKKAELKQLIEDGKKYYTKIVNDLKSKVRSIGFGKMQPDDWIERLKYVSEDIEDRNKAELDSIQKLIKEIEFYNTAFKRSFRNRPNVKEQIDEIVGVLKKAVVPPAYIEAFKNAKRQTNFVAQVKLYKYAVGKIPESLSDERKNDLISTYISPLVPQAVGTESINKNLSLLKSFKALLNMSKPYNKEAMDVALEEINKLIAEREKVAPKPKTRKAPPAPRGRAKPRKIGRVRR